MLQQHLAQVGHQATTTGTATAAAAGGGGDAGGSGKDAGQSSSSSGTSRSLKTSTSAGSSSRSQQQRGTLTSKLLHHQSKLEQALTSAGAPGKTPAYDGAQSLAAGIESGGGAALMTNFAALATGSNRQVTASASVPTDSGQQTKSPYINLN